jgi:hypothetical protein
MKYALLVYDAPGSWHDLSTEKRHARHAEYHALSDLSGIIAHYRLQPPQNTTTVRVEDDQVVRTEGPLAKARKTLRALYLVETHEPDSVLELAARIPAARGGGAVEVWPLTER